LIHYAAAAICNGMFCLRGLTPLSLLPLGSGNSV